MEIENKEISKKVFSKILEENKNNKSGFLSFKSCIFKSLIRIEDLEVDNINFIKCEFKKDIIIKNLKVDRLVIFKCKINKNFDCVSSKINELLLNYNIFNDYSTFVSLNSNSFKLGLNYFKEKVTFSKITVDKINLESSTFLSGLDFIIIKNLNKKELNSKNIANRETARIIKDSFEQQNNIIEANKFYALEMKERENELSPKKDFFEWVVFKIHGLVSNHSQDWVLVLFWIISLTFLTSFMKTIGCSFSQISEKIVLSFIAISIIFFININVSNTKKIYYIICSLVYYFIYSVFTKDFSLTIFSNLINPFSIMTGKEELSFGILLYKITIAYLIYQLIVSIRQNTRRK